MRKLFGKKQYDLKSCIATSLDALRQVNKSHAEKWELGKETAWKVDEQAGTINFSFADGREVSAPMQVIGTYHAKAKKFQWAWDHPSVPARLRQHAIAVQKFAQENGCDELRQSLSDCTEKAAWEYTALAMLIAEASGAYRAQIAADTYAFMTFGEITVYSTESFSV